MTLNNPDDGSSDESGKMNPAGRPVLDNLAFALGSVVGLAFGATVIALDGAVAVYDWAVSWFVIPPWSKRR